MTLMPGWLLYLSIALNERCLDLDNVEILQAKFYKLQWCSARDLFGSQIPVTIGGFEL